MDPGLVDRLRAGEERALAEAFDLLGPPLFSFLARLTRSRADAEDLVQETFVRLARSARGLAPDTDLRAFVFTVARNAARSHQRWARLDALRLLSAAHAPVRAPLTPEEWAQASQARRGLEAALGKLSFGDREALLLTAAEGLTPAQAAAALEIEGAAFRQRLLRARQRLAALIGDYTKFDYTKVEEAP